MTLLQELQATIRANSSSGGLPFALAAVAMPSNATRPAVSSVPPLGLSSRSSVRLLNDELDEMQQRLVRIAGSHSSTEVSCRESRPVSNDLNS